ncbi:HEAT repeat domain-containing protein [Desulfolithobacter sp.]
MQKNIESLQACLDALFTDHADAVVIGVSGQKMLVNDFVLPEKDQKRPHIKGLVSLMSHLQIDSVSFLPGITRDECETLLKEMAKGTSTQHIFSTSGLSLRELSLRHITIDGKRYLALQNDEQASVTTNPIRVDPAKDQAGTQKPGERLSRLLDGDLDVLKEPACSSTLPAHLAMLMDNNQEREADRLLGQLVIGLQDVNAEVRQHAGQALAETTKFLNLNQDWHRTEKLLPALEETLALDTTDEETARTLIINLGPFIAHLIDSGRYEAAHDILQRLHDTILGRVDGKSLLGALERTRQTIATPSRLEWLTEEYLHQKERRRKAGKLLSVLGRSAAGWLIDILGQSQERSERRLLLALLLEIGSGAQSELLCRLKKDAPWYLLRNIIRLLGEVGDGSCMDAILPYFSHKDLRVKKEVLVAAGNIGGPKLNDFLLHALQHGPRQLIGTVITLIGETENERFATPLCELLERNPFNDPHHRNELEKRICRALGRIGSKKAIPALKKILDLKKTPESVSDKVRETAEIALARIMAKNRSSEKDSSGTGKSDTFRQVAENGIQGREQQIFSLAASGETDKAKKKLVDLILTCARNHDFANAERLRDRIYEIDPLALKEIIRTGEIIEQEKADAINKDHLEVWADLMDELTSEEFAAIYHELEERNFQPEEIIVSQGEKNDELFFINQGNIRVSYLQGDRELFIKTLGSGELAGENFFNASLWTVTLTALTPVRLSVLRRKSFARWHEEFPGLESKLQDFYNRFNDIQSMLRKKNLDRRTSRRYEHSCKIQVQMIDAQGKKLGRAFRGSLSDISRGGLAFLVRISKKENGRLLLGRTMRLSIPTSDSDEIMHVTGTVIGVQPFHLPESDYSIHIRFNKDLDRETLQRILG